MTFINTTRTNTNGIFDRVMALAASVQLIVQRRGVYETTLTELNKLSDRELSDLGISRLSIQDVAKEAAYGK
jgi:uncharacterized protein YjiS (DUF1127 family)